MTSQGSGGEDGLNFPEILSGKPRSTPFTLPISSKSKRKHYSEIWRFMTKEPQKDIVNCKLCSNSYKSSTGTGTLWNHLKEKHFISKPSTANTAEFSKSSKRTRIEDKLFSKFTSRKLRLRELNTLAKLAVLENIFDETEKQIIKDRLKLLVREIAPENDTTSEPQNVQTYEYEGLNGV